MTLRRTLISLLPKLGFNVVDVAPGTIVVTRRKDVEVTAVTPRSWLLTRAAQMPELDPEELGTSREPTVQHHRLAPGADVLWDRGEARHHLGDVQRKLSRLITPEHVAWMLRKYRVNCVLDVGSNVGQYGLALRRAGYEGRIASFEPLPHLLERLEETAAGDPRWHVYPVALGREDGETEMTVVSGTLSSLLPPSEFGKRRHKRFDSAQTKNVSVRRLDGMLDEVLAGIDEPRPYLKLDTQGYDLEVFRGLGDRAREFVGMQSEVALVRVYAGMPRMAEALDVYESAGFEVTGMFPVSRDARTARVTEFDCVMVRADSASDALARPPAGEFPVRPCPSLSAGRDPSRSPSRPCREGEGSGVQGGLVVGVAVRLELERAVLDVEVALQAAAQLVEDPPTGPVRERALGHDDVCRQYGHAGGDRPGVQVVDVLDARGAEQVAAHLGQVDVFRRRLE